MMQNATMEEIARARDMPRAEIVTLLLLTAYADDNGIVVGTLDQIAERIGYGRGITATALKALVSDGRLVKLKRAVYRIPTTVCTPKNEHARGVAV